jgi:radical SAM protein with 4Fe4S-binding SPASM domain
MVIERAGHTQKSYGMRKEAREFPMMCVLSFVYICNAGCPNCPYNNSDIRETYKNSLIMPEGIFKKIAAQCGQYNTYIRISGGGEPMLHPQAIELMEYAKKKKARVGLITNGSLFTEESLYRLVSAGVDMIEFSVDAEDDVTYAKVRPGLDWKRLVENAGKAVKMRNEVKSQTKIIASVINQKGVDVKKAEKFWSQVVDEVQIRKYLTWGYVKDLSADSSPYLEPEERIPCPWLFERLNIDTRGDVTICGEDIAFKEKFTNVRDMSLREIWHHPKFEYVRKKHLARKGNEIPICKNCPDWKYRSWKHNYWKIVETAEKKRRNKLRTLQVQGMEDSIKDF